MGIDGIENLKPDGKLEKSNLEKYPKLYETPLPEEWSEKEFVAPVFTGVTVQKDLPTGDFRKPPPVDECPNIYMEEKSIIQVYTPSGWININTGYPEKEPRVINNLKVIALSIDDLPGPGYGEIVSIRDLVEEPVYQELTGDDIPYHLRSDSIPLAICDGCGREEWSSDLIGTIDTMTQPNGKSCGGRLVGNIKRDPIIWPDQIDFEPEDY